MFGRKWTPRRRTHSIYLIYCLPERARDSGAERFVLSRETLVIGDFSGSLHAFPVGPNFAYCFVTMKRPHHSSLLLAFLLCLGAGTVLALDPPKGKFILADRAEGTKVLDAIDFQPEGKCVVASHGHTDLKGTYSMDEDGLLTIVAPEASPATYEYTFRYFPTSMILTTKDGDEFNYAIPPAAPHPKESEVTGMFLVHTELGDALTELSADHTFRIHLHQYDNDEHTFVDIAMDGNWTYSDGIVEYRPKNQVSPLKFEYVRDFMTKRDDKGLWCIDAYLHNEACMVPVEKFELPNPPAGYHQAN